MRIDNITGSSFEGKFIVSQKLTKKQREFTERLINYGFDGKTNEEFLKNKNFDVRISGHKNKKCPRSKLFFQIGIKHIGTDADERGMDITTIKADAVRLDESFMQATCTLRNLINNTQEYIDAKLPAQYNTNFQKFVVKAKMLLGII